MRVALTVGLAMALLTPGMGVAAPPKARKTIKPAARAATVVSGDPAARAIVAGCGARRFETSAEVLNQGEKRVTRIKLCAKPGEDDAAWLRTLRQAREQIGGASQLAPASRIKLGHDLDAEIAQVEKGLPDSVPVPGAAPQIAGPPSK